VLQAVGTVSET